MFGSNDVYIEIPADKYIADVATLQEAVTEIAPVVNVIYRPEYNKPGVVCSCYNNDPEKVAAIRALLESAIVDLPFSWDDEFDQDITTVLLRAQFAINVLRSKGIL